MLPGLAAPRRVGILGVADPDAEAGKAGVEHLDALAARCRWQRAEKTVGDQFCGRPSRSCSGVSGLRLGYKPAALACKCVRTSAHRYSRKIPMGEGFM